MSALFMTVLIDKTLEVIKVKLEENNTLSERTQLEPDNIIQLLPELYVLPVSEGVLSPDPWCCHVLPCLPD